MTSGGSSLMIFPTINVPKFVQFKEY